MKQRIDAHQHFWNPDRGDYGWLTADLPELFKPFQPSDLGPLLKDHHVKGTILVQAAPTVAETEYLLELASVTLFVKGVVGWIDFENPDHLKHLERWSKHPLLKGIRPMVQDIQDPDWLLRSDIDWAFDALQEFGLVFDALVLPIHLPRLFKRLQRHPQLRVCIDHGAKPHIKNKEIDTWATDMAQLAECRQVMCKISGLVTEAQKQWKQEDILPYLDHLLRLFGPDRLLFGSDWPVLNLNGSYSQWINLLENWSQAWPETERDNLFAGNAINFYGL
jgi:L-fuconolactonase